MEKNSESIFIVEHMLELRHDAVGTFLDVRGFVADYIKKNGMFPHWQIVENSISFFDSPTRINDIGAVVSYNKIGFLSYDPSTQNYFEDKALKFWKTLTKNKHYTIPEINRFGNRIKCYIPSNLDFNEIKNKIFSAFFNEKSANTLGSIPTDLQLVFDLAEKDYQIRIVIGPVRQKEANRYFSFSTAEFDKNGIYIDMDYFKSGKISHTEIVTLLSKAMTLAWNKIENIKAAIGI